MKEYATFAFQRILKFILTQILLRVKGFRGVSVFIKKTPARTKVRPEGSRLGSYHYLIEAECASGITSQQIDSIAGIPEVRFLGCFDSREKQN